jgi:hypothetical protein
MSIDCNVMLQYKCGHSLDLSLLFMEIIKHKKGYSVWSRCDKDLHQMTITSMHLFIKNIGNFHVAQDYSKKGYKSMGSVG